MFDVQPAFCKPLHFASQPSQQYSCCQKKRTEISDEQNTRTTQSKRKAEKSGSWHSDPECVFELQVSGDSSRERNSVMT